MNLIQSHAIPADKQHQYNGIEPRAVLMGLIQQHSIRVVPSGQDFELSSGQLSRVYCDLKKTLLRSDAAMPFTTCLHRLIQNTPEFGGVGDTEKWAQAFAGVALGGCHLASLAATSSYMSYQGFERHTIYIRKEAKQHGTKNLIEAPDLPQGTRVILLEDVTTTANSAIKALTCLQEAGYNVLGVVTVVDRRNAWEDVTPPMDVQGVPFRSLFRLEELVDRPV